MVLPRPVLSGMRGTDVLVGRGAICLRAVLSSRMVLWVWYCGAGCYGVCGTELARMMLPARYAMSGTDRAYRATTRGGSATA
eukprot:2702621-Rhodomonas_salina.1